MTDLLSSDFMTPTCFTDAVIQVQDVKFPIHKIIMCKCSSMFRYVPTEVHTIFYCPIISTCVSSVLSVELSTVGK